MLRPAILEARALANMLPGFLGLCFLPWGLAPDISGTRGLHDGEHYVTEMDLFCQWGPGHAILSGNKAQKSKVLLARPLFLTRLYCVTVVLVLGPTG